MKIKPKRHIVWSTDEIDLDNPWVRKRYIEDVLVRGRSEDIRELDLEELKKIIPELTLPEYIRGLWNDYFSGFKQDAGS